MPNKSTVTTFLNVDLDVRAKAGDLAEFLRSIAPSVIVLHQTKQEASIELTSDFPSLEETVIGWIELIEGLPPQVRNAWDELEFRKLNIGIQAGCEPHAAAFTISGKTVALLACVFLEITFTVYAPLAG